VDRAEVVRREERGGRGGDQGSEQRVGVTGAELVVDGGWTAV